MASEMRGLRRADSGEALLVVVGRFGVGSFIRVDFFRFRFVHHGDGDFVFSHSPVAEVAFAAARAAERKFRGRFGINRLLANWAFQFHGRFPSWSGLSSTGYRLWLFFSMARPKTQRLKPAHL